MYTSSTILFGGILGIVLVFVLLWLKKHKSVQEHSVSDIDMFKQMFDVSTDAVLVLSENNEVQYTNKALRTLFVLPQSIVGKLLEPMPKLKIKDEWIQIDEFIHDINLKEIGEMHAFPQVELSISAEAHSIPVNIYINHFISDTCKTGMCYILVIQDLRKEYELSKILYRHKLTNLPNQLQAKTDLNKLFSQIHLHNKKLALVLLDVDNFAQIRALIGYEQSENIMIRIARFLEQFVQENGFYVYHTFSNNFLLSLPHINSSNEAVEIVRQIQRELATLYKINGVQFHLTASAGISIYPDSGSTRILLDRAFKALTEAQKIGFGAIQVYKRSEIEKKYDELELFNAIHEAIGKEEFEVYYQPIVRAQDQEVVAAEALIRWKHSEHGYVPPDIFIPMLEKSGFIIQLGRYMLTEVLKQQKRWELFKFKPIEVSINTSLLEIESEGFVEHVAQKLEEHQVQPELIKFEITEGTAMENEDFANRQLYALRHMGISIALDDFGTGYTSFSYLKRFPAEVLKIDKTLVDNILENEEDQRIVKAMIELGKTLGMKIVVEGIENKAMGDMVASYGCDYLQGYYFSRPLPAYEFQKLIRK